MEFKVTYVCLTVLAFASAQVCRTPDQKNGLCVDISQCDFFNSNLLFGIMRPDQFGRCPNSEVSGEWRSEAS